MRASALPSDWNSDGRGLELVEVLEQSAECDFADSRDLAYFALCARRSAFLGCAVEDDSCDS